MEREHIKPSSWSIAKIIYLLKGLAHKADEYEDLYPERIGV